MISKQWCFLVSLCFLLWDLISKVCYLSEPPNTYEFLTSFPHGDILPKSQISRASTLKTPVSRHQRLFCPIMIMMFCLIHRLIPWHFNNKVKKAKQNNYCALVKIWGRQIWNLVTQATTSLQPWRWYFWLLTTLSSAMTRCIHQNIVII